MGHSARSSKQIYPGENRIASNEFEIGFLVTKDRSTPTFTDNEEGSVKIPEEYLGDLKGSILVHNHPNGGPFSDDDIGLLVYYDLAEIRAVTKNGIARLTKISEKGTKYEFAYDYEKQAEEYVKNVTNPKYNELTKAYSTGRISETEYSVGVKSSMTNAGATG